MRFFAAPGGAGAAAGAVGLLLLAASGAARGQDWIPLDARSQALGSAGVALAEGPGGLYWNPALAASGAEKPFDFDTGFGFALHGGGLASLEGGLIDDVVRAVDFYEYYEFSDIQDRINLGLNDPAIFQDLVRIFDSILATDQPGKGALAHAGGGFELRIGPLALFCRALGTAVGDPVVDLDSPLGFTCGDLTAFFAGLGSPGALSPAGSALSAALVAADARLALDSDGDGASDADELAYQAQAALGDAGISNPAFVDAYCRAAVATLASAGTGNASATIYYNNSGVELRTLVQVEAGLTLGIPLFPTLLEAGVSVKEIITDSFRRRLTFREIDENDDLAEQVRDDYREQHKRANDFNIDLGLLVRPTSWLRVGVTGRNLIPMTVDLAGSGDDLRLRPQVRLGAAVRLFDLLNVGADLDLTENRVGLLPGLASRHFGGGIELDLSVVRIRGGFFDNLASDTGRGTLTAGLGLRICGFLLDVSAQAGLRQRVVRPLSADGEKEELSLPERALVGVTLGYDRSF